jgi:hypothetical protein
MQLSLIGPIGTHPLCEQIEVSEHHSVLRCAIENCLAFEDFTTRNESEYLRAVNMVSEMTCNP